MSRSTLLSKSRFKLAIECPTKLFYCGKNEEYEDVSLGNDFLEMLAEGGYQVGALAKQASPDGIEVEGLDTVQAEVKTQEYLQLDNVVLFEPAIRVGNFFIRIDILIKTGNSFELIEVKAKSYDSQTPAIEGKRGGISSGMLPYIQDVAFQVWVLKQAFPKSIIHAFMMMPDKAKLAPVDGVNQMFKITKSGRSIKVDQRIPSNLQGKALALAMLEKVSVDKYVSQVLNNPIEFPGGQEYLSDIAVRWSEAYRKDEKIPPVLGAQCGSCQYKAISGDKMKSGFKECWTQAAGFRDKDFAAGTVLDLWNFRGKQKLIDCGIYGISQVNREDIGEFEDQADSSGLSRAQRQWLQVGGIPSHHPHVDYYLDDNLVTSEMSQWKFPFHFIDFETSSVALPFYEGMRPYEPVAFQFSHHVMYSDGAISHQGQFLCAEPGEFPNFDFVRSLMEELNKDEGSVFMWSHHENTILNKIIEQLHEMPNSPDDRDELIGFIKTLIKGGGRAMIDLCQLSEKAFFHPDTKGSNSIKKVLPAVLKISDWLQQEYSKRIYGASGGIQSLNFRDFVWVDSDVENNFDPYIKLKQFAVNMLPEGAETDSVIAEGGAAATAYARLQFEDLGEDERDRIKSALLRYCELDTLAMVMVVQGWRACAGFT